MSDIDIKELYKIAIDTRNFEINLFWQRSNYFIALNTGIAIGTFFKSSEGFRIPLAVLGAVISFLWICMNLGSRYWQVRWEHEAAQLEMKITNEILFSANKSRTYEVVKHYLSNDTQKNIKLSLLDKLILLKPSVNKTMICVSLVFVVFWILVLVWLLIFYASDVNCNSLDYYLVDISRKLLTMLMIKLDVIFNC